MTPASKKLVDILNLNADASCLSSNWWLKMLKGGADSYLCAWLQGYVDLAKKATLGITGASVADMAMHNPEAIALINANRHIFEILQRPFAHDIGLLRSFEGFKLNCSIGAAVLEKEFGTFTPFFLPPEFMLTNEQVFALYEMGVQGAFINANRYKEETRQRIPKQPYQVIGMGNAELHCIPFTGEVTRGYLDGIHNYNATAWNERVMQREEAVVFSWRDGESSFFVPNGNAREQAWLADETRTIERTFLSEQLPNLHFESNEDLEDSAFKHYPVHSFTAWMKEFRMMGFVQKLADQEKQLSSFGPTQLALWLHAINSDILSSVEKNSPIIQLRLQPADPTTSEYVIWRKEKVIGGEEALNFLVDYKAESVNRILANKKSRPYQQKMAGRIAYLNRML